MTHTTQDLNRVFTTLGQIIDQELAFLCQLTLFKDMLTNAEIFTDVSQRLKRAARISGSLQQPTNILEQGLPVPIVNSVVFNYAKRSITDIFTPYSVSSIGDTANRNFLAMNSNFQTIQATELKLAHQQTQLAKKFHLMEKKMRQIRVFTCTKPSALLRPFLLYYS